jgi:crotonobetainyl-CoA:carnitine CoA-transferase CaiB-like acyl-CoA transferase
MQKPLQGIKVLDLGQGVAAPYCGLLMAQYGAEVIKVEPLNGDWMRGLGKNWKGQTAYSVTYNLGKKGIAVDLKKQEGINLILKIAETCDVVLENFRPGVVDRLGIGFSDIKAINDKVLYVSVSGFGQTGPYNERPGSDGVLQAFSGLVSINKDNKGFPHRVGTTVVDALTGLCTFQATSMALFGGITEAKFLDISLLQSAAVLLMPNIADFSLNQGPALALNPPAGTYKTKDGWFGVSIVKEQNFADLCRLIGVEEAISDERFKTSEKRAENITQITEIIQSKLKNKTSEYWDRAFKEAGLLANPVNDFGDWLDDEHVKAIEGYGIVEQPEVGKVPIARLPGGLKMDGIAPNIGSNTKDVMLEYGYSLDQVEQLNREKVVFAPELSN